VQPVGRYAPEARTASTAAVSERRSRRSAPTGSCRCFESKGVHPQHAMGGALVQMRHLPRSACAELNEQRQQMLLCRMIALRVRC